jgi:flagellar motility protein MotE (MotC chaperone)
MVCVVSAQPVLAQDVTSSDEAQELMLSQGEFGYADLLRAIRDERTALQQREQNLVKNEKRLAEMKAEISALLESNQVLVDKLQKARLQTDKAKVRLAKIYGGMPPEEAAARIQKMNNDLAVILLRHMKDKATGAILGQLPAKKAAEITVSLTKSIVP